MVFFQISLIWYGNVLTIKAKTIAKIYLSYSLTKIDFLSKWPLKNDHLNWEMCENER